MAERAREKPDFAWRVSSYSANAGGNCIEVGLIPGDARIAVRDTKSRERGHFSISRAAWTSFVHAAIR